MAEEKDLTCSICEATRCRGRQRSSPGMLCAACLREELAPLREKVTQARRGLPLLRQRYAETFETSEARGRVRREALEVAAECERLERALREEAESACRERAKAASLRRALAERRRSLDKAEAALTRRRAQVEALQRAVAGRKDVEAESSSWRRVDELFALFPIKSAAATTRSLRGVMTIVGLPLPNVGSGAVLSEALPREVCASALAAVALLTAVLAEVLHVHLPHPLVPRTGTDTAAAVCGDAGTQRKRSGQSLVDDDDARQSRPRSWGKSSRYALAPGGDTFVIALSLLQNDVTHLCVKAGLDPAHLWPAEALLLNLAELRAAASRRLHHGGDVPVDDDDDSAHSDDCSSRDDHRPSSSSSHRRGDADTDTTSSVADDDNDDWIFLGNLPFLGLSSAPASEHGDDDRP